MTLEQVKDVAEILSSVGAFGATLAALYWFLFTRSFARRIELSCDLRVIDCGDDQPYLCELVLIVENKGQREHRLYNLWSEVRQPRGVQSDGDVVSYAAIKNHVPAELVYFFVQAGIRQEFPRTFTIPRSQTAVRAIAVFSYDRRRITQIEGLSNLTFENLDAIDATTHTYSRLFDVRACIQGNEGNA